MLLAIALATAPLASALAQTPQDKATARALAEEGILAEQKGDCAKAIDRLERAESLYHAPPHLRYLARCYVKTGRLVDATETWRKLTNETLAPNAPPAFKEAVAEANAELPKLEPRLARLTISPAEPYTGLKVTVDGKEWPGAVIGVPRVIDPGTHAVVSRATGYKTKEDKVDLGEGKSESITVTLEAGADATAVPTASASTSATVVPTASASASTTADVPKNSPLRTVGFIAVGVGVVALAGGVFTGLSAKSKFNDLDKACPNRATCALPDLADRKSSIHSLETTTNILLIGGGVLAAAGLGLVLFAPSGKSKSSAVSWVFSPSSTGGHVAVTGTF